MLSVSVAVAAATGLPRSANVRAGGTMVGPESVFHSPQCGHWPCHLTDSPWQASQMWTNWGLAKA
jgi:hypothetical protein